VALLALGFLAWGASACSSSASDSGAASTGGSSSGGSTAAGSGGSSSLAGADSLGGTDSGGSATGGAAAGGAGAGGAAAGGAAVGSAGATAGAGGAYTYTGPCAPAAPDVPAGELSLRIAGDSTAAIFPATDPRVGWGAVAQQFFLAMVKVADSAASGRSSKSFIDEGLWSAMKTQIKAGDYVFIGFGHNDEKTADPLRYTDPATTYREYLKTYVCEARNLGAIPVLLTPISRRSFAGTMISPTHGAYPAAVLAVGAETSTPVIDMTERTRVWLEALGPTDSVPYFAPGDNTHLSAMGAPEVAKLVVSGIKDLKLPLASELAP